MEEDLRINKTFNCVLIDTSAFDRAWNDFSGAISKKIPSFSKAIKENNLKLLSHPVLLKETSKHITSDQGDSFRNRINDAINAIRKNQTILKIVPIDTEKVIDTLTNIGLVAQEEDDFKKFFASSTQLPYGDPAKVFEEYFSATPPFAQSGKKKSEFPDAFVITALQSYIADHPQDAVLVVTGDNDWKKALEDNSNIVLCENIDEAINAVTGQVSQVEELLDKLSDEIEHQLKDKANELWFVVRDYPEAEDVEVSNIDIVLINWPIILDIKNNEISVQVSIDITADGSTTVLDLNHSIWDSEEKTYIFSSYSALHFEEAHGRLDCIISLTADTSQNWKVSSVEVVIPDGIELELDTSKIHFEELFNNDDFEAEVMESLQDYFFH